MIQTILVRSCALGLGRMQRLFTPLLLTVAGLLSIMPTAVRAESEFPRPLSSYADPSGSSMVAAVWNRAAEEPFNILTLLIFLAAVIHTFLAPAFTRKAHAIEKALDQETPSGAARGPQHISAKAKLYHFLGEVEATFGIWAIPLIISIAICKGWGTAKQYLDHSVNFTEPLFVVIIMAIAASRPILKLVERMLGFIAAIGKGSVAAWWLTILTAGPLLGSFITEPAAMTICSLLLVEKLYARGPSRRLAYATLGLLFVNISVGGTLTHFAAPPVIMVAKAWNWGIIQMVVLFGWKSALGILGASAAYFMLFRKDLARLEPTLATAQKSSAAAIPFWITAVHLSFLAWTVINSHHPVLFIGGFLFYVAFTQVTMAYQDELRLRGPLMVGFFLAGLVIHGTLQGWWIGPILSRLGETSLFFGALALTAFNDNAAITYLASLVPDLSESLRFAVVAGAMAGGGLTVIANAPNPAGQSILAPYFRDGISALQLLFAALLPTIIMILAYLFLP